MKNNNIKKATEELGDILFSLIGYAQKVGINSVNALEKTNKKFMERFNQMEDVIAKEKKHISDYSVDELNIFWNMVKK